MAEGLEYTVTLVDKITAPAKQAAAAVTTTTKSLVTFDAVLKEVERRKAEALTDVGKQADLYLANVKKQQEAVKNAEAAKQAAYTENIDKMKAKDLDAAKANGELTASIGKAALAFEAAAAAAAAYALVAGLKLSLEATEAKAKLTSMFDALGQGAITGKQTIAMLDQLGTTTGMTREQLAPLAKEFMAMGVTSVDALKKMTTAAASAQAIMGDPSAANAFTTLQKKIQEAADTGTKLKIPAKGLANLAEMGLSVSDVAKQMGVSANTLANQLKAGTVDAAKFGDALQDALITKGAGPLDRMSKSVDAMRAKFTENISKMFEDVDPGPFLSALKDLASIFDQSTTSGKAMKSLVTSVFDGLFKIGARILPILKHGFLELVIVALKIYIAAKPLVSELKKLFGTGTDDTVTKALIFIVDWMGRGIVVAIQFFTVMIHFWEGVYQAIQPVIKAVEYVIDAIAKASKAIAGLTSAASSAGSGAGGAVGAGLIKGISAATGGVVGAGVDLGKSAIKGVTSALGIASPSKVMMQLGAHTTEGFAKGVDATAPRAQSAMSSMTAPPDRGASAGASSGGVAVTFNVYGVEGAADLKAELPSLLAQAFERMQLMAGT